jgi:hypothetical protein
MIGIGAKKYDFSLKNGTGLSAGEHVIFGVAGKHEYTVRDLVEEDRVIDGKKVKQKFVVLVNPWKTSIRTYDEMGRPKFVPQYGEDVKNGYDHGGVFKMELRDFMSTADKIYYT